jgi:hypothetical protein
MIRQQRHDRAGIDPARIMLCGISNSFIPQRAMPA